MGKFRKYDHLERKAHPDVADICFGTVHVFPKIDGTNASVWAEPVDDPALDSVHVCCGSRKRVLSANDDNHGFHAFVFGDDVRAIALRMFVMQFPDLVVYGVWLVPHTLKTYREDAWRRFYVFDVWSRVTKKYLPHFMYAATMANMGIDVIPPLAVIKDPSEEQLAGLRDVKNTYLIKDDVGVGEGIVLKNYDWTDKHGRQPWAKVVRGEFKDDNAKMFGPRLSSGPKQVEREIVAALCTPEFIRKEFAKVVNAVAKEAETRLILDTMEPESDIEMRWSAFIEVNRGKIIPRFLGTVYHEFVTEECWAFVKKFKNPIVDFGKLQKLVTLVAKVTMKDIF